jgi:hypothetical protein
MRLKIPASPADRFEYRTPNKEFQVKKIDCLKTKEQQQSEAWPLENHNQPQ